VPTHRRTKPARYLLINNNNNNNSNNNDNVAENFDADATLKGCLWLYIQTSLFRHIGSRRASYKSKAHHKHLYTKRD